jgi:CHAT domain-containing protein
MTGDDPRVVEDAQATRDTIDRAFAQPGAWVHVAAHGMADPQRIGYAGLWLEPKPPETAPAFLSWIDVLDRGVRSDLVVLDACQTGDSGTAVNGNLSFADAVSRAGSHHVLAVMWPASDAASAVWVPAFYAALAADANHDAAEALRVAQQRLRASRAFGHPFYWAGMQTIERWPIGSIGMH